MDGIVLATWGLVVATLLLFAVSVAQARSARGTAASSAKTLTERLAILAAQAEALTLTAEANERVAAEMLEARRAAKPLKVRVQLTENMPFALRARVTSEGDGPVILRRAVLFRGQGPDTRAEVGQRLEWGNAYLGQHDSEGYPISIDFVDGVGDLLTLEVSGRPVGGLEQTVQLVYRIRPQGTLEDLAALPDAFVAFG